MDSKAKNIRPKTVSAGCSGGIPPAPAPAATQAKQPKAEASRWLETPAKFGVYGVMEWVAVIPAGRSLVRVSFTGGSMSGFGQTPATFTTHNRAVAAIIRKSNWFATGRIVALS